MLLNSSVFVSNFTSKPLSSAIFACSSAVPLHFLFICLFTLIVFHAGTCFFKVRVPRHLLAPESFGMPRENEDCVETAGFRESIGLLCVPFRHLCLAFWTQPPEVTESLGFCLCHCATLHGSRPSQRSASTPFSGNANPIYTTDEAARSLRHHLACSRGADEGVTRTSTLVSTFIVPAALVLSSPESCCPRARRTLATVT